MRVERGVIVASMLIGVGEEVDCCSADWWAIMMFILLNKIQKIIHLKEIVYYLDGMKS